MQRKCNWSYCLWCDNASILGGLEEKNLGLLVLYLQTAVFVTWLQNTINGDLNIISPAALLFCLVIYLYLQTKQNLKAIHHIDSYSEAEAFQYLTDLKNFLFPLNSQCPLP